MFQKPLSCLDRWRRISPANPSLFSSEANLSRSYQNDFAGLEASACTCKL